MKSVSLVALCACSLFLDAARAADEQADQQKLQGKWIVDSFEFDGMPVDQMTGATREFVGDKYTLVPKSGESYSGTFKLAPGESPKQIDLIMPDRTLQGIYELDGQILKMAYTLDGDARPTELASKPGTGVVLVVHKKAN